MFVILDDCFVGYDSVLGLCECKKQQIWQVIYEVVFCLIDEQGFEVMIIEQICGVVDVLICIFFNYFLLKVVVVFVFFEIVIIEEVCLCFLSVCGGFVWVFCDVIGFCVEFNFDYMRIKVLVGC